jgi:hypothetical protein
MNAWLRKTLLTLLSGDGEGAASDSFGGGTDGQPAEAPRVFRRVSYGAIGERGTTVALAGDEAEEVSVLIVAADLALPDE